MAHGVPRGPICGPVLVESKGCFLLAEFKGLVCDFMENRQGASLRLKGLVCGAVLVESRGHICVTRVPHLERRYKRAQEFFEASQFFPKQLELF